MQMNGHTPSALSLVFFFQAEDGIRDKLVTGVQTCALPIPRQRVAGAKSRVLKLHGKLWPVIETSTRLATFDKGDRTKERAQGPSDIWQSVKASGECASDVEAKKQTTKQQATRITGRWSGRSDKRRRP